MQFIKIRSQLTAHHLEDVQNIHFSFAIQVPVPSTLMQSIKGIDAADRTGNNFSFLVLRLVLRQFVLKVQVSITVLEHQVSSQTECFKDPSFDYGPRTAP